MSREPIVGSGRKGFGFEQKGFQEKNLQLLLETLSKKETQKSIEALSKIEKDEWKAMAAAATELNSFLSLGGTSQVFTSMAESIKETIKLQIDALLAPITNEINSSILNLLNPFIEWLTPVINELSTFLSENQVGVGVGGIAGYVLGSFTPLGPIVGGIVGAIVGALIEVGYETLDDLVSQGPPGAPYTPDVTALYEAETGNTFTSIFDWAYIDWYQNVYLLRNIPDIDTPGQLEGR